MATLRKPGLLRMKPSKPVKKTSAKAAGRRVKPAASGSASAKPGARPAVVKAPAAKPGVSKAVAAAIKKSGKGPVRPQLSVRPMGVLPPESMARGSQRPAKPLPAAPRADRAAAKSRRDTVPAQAVTEKDYKDLERRLLVEREKILKEMGHLETTVLKVNQRDSAGDLSGYSFHMADVGTDAMEREKAFLFASNEGRLLMQIDEALRRVYRGEYGVCENCGEPISRARLEAMPYARLCVACKEKEERESRGAL